MARAPVPRASHVSARRGTAPAHAAAAWWQQMGHGGLLEGEVGRRKSVGEIKSVPLRAALGAHGGRSQRSTCEGLCGGRAIAASCQNNGQTGKTEEQRRKSLPAQGTTVVLSLITAKWLIHTFILFFPAQIIQATQCLT